jgi:hypothetical protein
MTSSGPEAFGSNRCGRTPTSEPRLLHEPTVEPLGDQRRSRFARGISNQVRQIDVEGPDRFDHALAQTTARRRPHQYGRKLDRIGLARRAARHRTRKIGGELVVALPEPRSAIQRQFDDGVGREALELFGLERGASAGHFDRLQIAGGSTELIQRTEIGVVHLAWWIALTDDADSRHISPLAASRFALVRPSLARVEKAIYDPLSQVAINAMPQEVVSDEICPIRPRSS